MALTELLAGVLPVGTTVVMVGLAIWHGKELVGFFGSASMIFRMLTVVAVVLVVATIFGVVEIHVDRAIELVMGPIASALKALVEFVGSVL